MAAVKKTIFQANTGLLKYLVGLPKTKNEPEMKLLTKAKYKIGVLRLVISVIFCDGTARPNKRRFNSTAVPIITAMPRI